MPKNKPIYVCTDCGYESAKWMGRCPSCGAWNKMEEQAPAAPRRPPALRGRARC